MMDELALLTRGLEQATPNLTTLALIAATVIGGSKRFGGERFVWIKDSLGTAGIVVEQLGQLLVAAGRALSEIYRQLKAAPVSPGQPNATRAAAGTLVALALALVLSSPLGCTLASTQQQIQQSTLSPIQKAQASLFAAESDWVSTKQAAVSALRDATACPGPCLTLPEQLKLDFRTVRDAGNAAVVSAQLAIDQQSPGWEATLAASLRALSAATLQIRTITGGL